MSEILKRFTNSLRPHPILARVPTLPELIERERRLAKSTGKDRAEHAKRAEELEAEWAAFCEDVAAHGVLERVKVCGDEIIDGRHRWLASLAAGLKEVRVEVVPEHEAREVMLSTVASRRHFSKGAIAYIGILGHPEVATEGEARAKAGAPSALSAGGLAARVGVSLRLIEQAAALFREVSGFPRLQAEAEAAVFTGAGLGAVCGWVKAEKLAAEASDGPAARAKRAPNYSQLAPASLVTLRNAASHWSEIKPDAQEAVIGGLRDVLGALPPAVRDAILHTQA